MLQINNLDRPSAIEVDGAAQIQAVGRCNDDVDGQGGAEVLDQDRARAIADTVGKAQIAVWPMESALMLDVLQVPPPVVERV